MGVALVWRMGTEQHCYSSKMLSRFLTVTRACAPQRAHVRMFASSGVSSVAVFGAGLMGAGIAQVSAASGKNVTLIDVNQDVVDKGFASIQKSIGRVAKKKNMSDDEVAAIVGRITPSTEVASAAGADLVIEAIVENLDIKRKLFTELDGLCGADTLFASNTSSLRIGDISKGIRPERFGGMHFFNPVPVMGLVEIIKTEATSEDTFVALKQYGREVGKKVVSCRDTPGFVVNRLLVPYLMEAVRMLERGDATAEDIDTAMKLGAGHPMGPFQLLDYVGLDTTKFIMDGWHNDFPEEPLFNPSEKLNELVKDGKLGLKSGAGFFDYSKDK